MTYTQIGYLIGVGIVCFINILSCVLSVAKSKKSATVTNNVVVDDTTMTDLLMKCVDAIKAANEKFKILSEKSGMQTGVFKLESVLNQMRDFCTSAGVIFDPTFWREKIEMFVELMNCEKNNAGSATLNGVSGVVVQSTELEK